jgi:hypothetical protein
MKRVLLLLVAAILIPGVLGAQTMGVYFDPPGSMVAYPANMTLFEGYLYIHNADYQITGVEYYLWTPDDPTHALVKILGTAYPDNMSVDLGDPFDAVLGHTIAYWPPLNGFIPGYNLLATYDMMLWGTTACWNDGGSLIDFEIIVTDNPDSGELRGTYAPDNLKFPIIGLTSLLCPSEPIGVEEESWGAIKSLYK